MYLKIEEAEELKKAYSSWIGKKAHIGNGVTDTLKKIIIRRKRPNEGLKVSNGEKVYRIEFEFESEKKLSAVEFLFYNSLIMGQAYSGTIKKQDRAA